MKHVIQSIFAAAFAASVLPAAAHANQVIATDLIVQGSACVGFDCSNGESFGFDTLRLKENNTRIAFVDTSNSASFPTTDWELQANESTNGGQNQFAIIDRTAGNTIFVLEGAAPRNSLYVDDQGRVGVGTSTPVVELHVVDGDSPTLRLEQNGSSGFTPQTWDVAGNESNFFIRDATNASQLPFKIKPGAPTNSLFLAANGDVGLGTQSPSENLSIVSSDNRAAIQLQSAGSTQHFQILWNGTEARFSNQGSGALEMALEPGGNMDIAGRLATGSTCLQMDDLACTFSAGGGASCSVAICP